MCNNWVTCKTSWILIILVIKFVLAFCKRNNEMCPCINRNARPNNNQLITYYLPVCDLLRIQQDPVNTTYNMDTNRNEVSKKTTFPPSICIYQDQSLSN